MITVETNLIYMINELTKKMRAAEASKDFTTAKLIREKLNAFEKEAMEFTKQWASLLQ